MHTDDDEHMQDAREEEEVIRELEEAPEEDQDMDATETRDAEHALLSLVLGPQSDFLGIPVRGRDVRPPPDVNAGPLNDEVESEGNPSPQVHRLLVLDRNHR